MQNVINLVLDLKNKNYNYIVIQQNDDVVIEAELYDNGIPVDLSNHTVIANFTAANDAFINIAGSKITKNNNKTTIVCEKYFSQSVGNATGQITLVDATSKQVSTFPFKIKVNKGVIQNSTSCSNASSVLNAITEANMDALRNKSEIESAVSMAKDNIKDINNTYVSASELVKTVNLTRNQFDNCLSDDSYYIDLDNISKYKNNNIHKLYSCKNINNTEHLINNVFLETRMDSIDSGIKDVELKEDYLFNFANTAKITVNSNSKGVAFNINKNLAESDNGKFLQFSFITNKSNLNDFEFAGLIIWRDGMGSNFNGGFSIATNVKKIDDEHFFWSFKKELSSSDMGSNTVIEKLYFKVNTSTIPYDFNIMLPIATLSDNEIDLFDEIVNKYYFTNKKVGFNQDISNKISFNNGYWKKVAVSGSLDCYSYIPLMRNDTNFRHCPSRTISFYTDSSFVNMYYLAEGDKVEVKVNGVSSLVQLQSGNTWKWVTIANELKGVNRIDIIVKYRLTVSGFEINSDSFLKSVVTPHKKILFFGDSITNGGVGSTMPSSTFAYKVAKTLNLQTCNQGIPASKMHTDGEDRVDTDIIDNPDYIFILYGANDLGQGVTVENFKTSYDNCVKSIKEKVPNAKIFIGNMIKRADESSMPITFSNYQTAIKEVCENNDCIFVDTYDSLPDSTTNYLIDGIHPNDNGHDVISNYIVDSIKKYL